MMARRFDAPVRAILGPTNTGKTYLAIERMCGHSSGVIGFPLRLLAREVYDRVVGLKGEKQVALLTGEERIVPATARYFLCTAESMPITTASSTVILPLQRSTRRSWESTRSAAMSSPTACFARAAARRRLSSARRP
jgi:hypothetical protein